MGAETPHGVTAMGERGEADDNNEAIKGREQTTRTAPSAAA